MEDPTYKARPRGLPTFAMPPGGSDKPSQAINGGFSASGFLPNKNIWNQVYANSRSQDADDAPSGSSALNANSQADLWGGGPWNKDRPARPVSASPNRSQKTNGGAVYGHQQAPVGARVTGYGSHAFQDESSNYASLAAQRRQVQDASQADPMMVYSLARDALPPPSRRSQGSPVFGDLYSQMSLGSSAHPRRAPGHAPSFSTQSAQSMNSRAFNYNKQVDEELLQLTRRMNIENNSPVSAASFDAASQPFQLNPGTQPWIGDAAVPKSSTGLDLGSDAFPGHLGNLKQQAIDRVSPASGYRQDSTASSRGYASTPDPWGSRPPSRDLRVVDLERRAAAFQYNQNFQTPFFPGQYAYNGLPNQFGSNLLDPFSHSVRAGYGLTHIPGGYPYNSSAIAHTRSHRNQDPSKDMRSSLLDEFRLGNRSNRRLELKDILGHVVEFSGDQHGSRFIQQKLENANSDDKDQVFREIEPNAVPIMKDVFGNYVVQKLFEHGSQIQKKVLAEKMKGRVIDLSTQTYSCRVVQKALDHVLVEQQAELTKELEPEILRVIRDQQGNHVVQKIVELVPRQHIGFIMDAIRGQVTALASHTYGCRVIQRFLEHGSDHDKVDIMKELHASSQILITDQYGNYVAQHVIEKGKPEDRQKIIDLVMAQLVMLSKHKFASNVVEKCIEHGTPQQRSQIREQLTTAGSDGTSPLQQMMRDQYGNYVIQKLLTQLFGEERELFSEEVKPQFFLLKRNGGSRQLQALEKLLGVGSNGPVPKQEASSGPQPRASSATPTPVLTNETNSPESSSPSSLKVAAVSLPNDESSKPTASTGNARVAPTVQEDHEA